MKRMLCMVLAGTMLVSMMPATVFAKGDISAVAKVVGAMEVTKAQVEANNKIVNETLGDMPELQLKIQDATYAHTSTGVKPEETEVTISLDNAKFLEGQDFAELIHVMDDDQKWVIYDGVSQKDRLEVSVDENDIEEDTVTFTFNGNFEKDDIIVIDLYSVMNSTSEGKSATVSVASEMVNVDDLTYVTVMGKGVKASVKKVETVGLREIAEISSNGLKIESAVGYLPGELTLKLSKGFEFATGSLQGENYNITRKNDTELTVAVEDNTKEITITGASGINGGKGIEIEAVTAKEGDVATIRVSAKNYDSTSVDVLKVVDADVELSVDDDKDLPIIYSGVGVDNYGLTDDSDHLSLEITVEESFPGAWDLKKAFQFQLPEGVYVAAENEDGVTGVDVTKVEGLYLNGTEAKPENVEAKFLKAYQDGNHLSFEFKRRSFDDMDASKKDECAKLTFTLALVADPNFEGDVTLKMTGDAIEEQEVDIATFVKPYEIKAEQNELKIDYRNTKVPTAIAVTEAEAGLWEEKEAVFSFGIDKEAAMEFEKNATFTVNADSEMELNNSTSKSKGKLSFQVKEGSDEEAAVVTIDGMELYISRNIPAGYYDLMLETSMEQGSDMETAFSGLGEGTGYLGTALYGGIEGENEVVEDVTDYDNVVKEGFLNIITPGRDEEGFTTKVVVPVGESYITAGEKRIELDVPAYINAAGYTMLPVRAVAKALGIDSNAVLWDQPTRTVTIMHGQRIISMTLGQKVVYVNGSAIPASSAVEITDGRTFLPMRDLANALGVTDITWDSATRTATLNGNR